VKTSITYKSKTRDWKSNENSKLFSFCCVGLLWTKGVPTLESPNKENINIFLTWWMMKIQMMSSQFVQGLSLKSMWHLLNPFPSNKPSTLWVLSLVLLLTPSFKINEISSLLSREYAHSNLKHVLLMLHQFWNLISSL
jgi:hypothetical protein